MNSSEKLRIELKVKDKVKEIAQQIFTISQENIIKMKAFDSGFLLRSGEVRDEGETVIIEYSCPYAKVVEYGREPGHMPPVEPIKDWSKKKFGLSEKEATSRGWAIATKIKKEGVDARPFLRDAIDYTRVRGLIR